MAYFTWLNAMYRARITLYIGIWLIFVGGQRADYSLSCVVKGGRPWVCPVLNKVREHASSNTG